MSAAVDPLLDAKVLLEGVGVLVNEIEKFSATKPAELNEDKWNLKREQIIKMMHDYLDLAAVDYPETSKEIPSPLTPPHKL